MYFRRLGGESRSPRSGEVEVARVINRTPPAAAVWYVRGIILPTQDAVLR